MSLCGKAVRLRPTIHRPRQGPAVSGLSCLPAFRVQHINQSRTLLTSGSSPFFFKMKFAHRFKTELLEQGFPQRWVDDAVPYSQLKKVIKKLCNELNEYGLDIASLAQAQPIPSDDHQNKWDAVRRGSDGTVTFQYNLAGSTKAFRPKLTLFFENDQAVDATLSPSTRAFLGRLTQKSTSQIEAVEDTEAPKPTENKPEGTSPTEAADSTDGPVLRKIEIPLTFDAQFFDLLHNDVSSLDAIRAEEEQTLTRDIHKLSKEISRLAKPTRFGKTDMYRWRELFDLYLQAAVFFSTQECDTGSRNPVTAAKQLEWFQSEVTKRGIVASFKRPESHRALTQFVQINIVLLKNLRFQDINKVAVEKILKKFDKRTKLGAGKMAPRFIQADSLMTQTMAKAVCAQVTQDIVKITPQLDDYLCPICFTIAYVPVKMKCEHVLCTLCTVTLQTNKTKSCPLCRDKSVMDANDDNIDTDFKKFLEKHFPKETRLKQIELETHDGKQIWGPTYTHPSEDKCAVM